MTAGEFTSCAKCGRAIVASNHRCYLRPSATISIVSSDGVPRSAVMMESVPKMIAERAADLVTESLRKHFGAEHVLEIAPPRTIKPKGSLTPTQSVIMDAARTFTTSFTREDLAVRCFERRPTMFALRGYPHLLNTSAVWCRINGQGGLIYRGFLAQSGDQLRVTRAGGAK